MPEKKKRSKKKLKIPPAHPLAPVFAPAAGKTKKKRTPILFAFLAGAAALLILFWLIGKFAESENKQPLSQSNESKAETRRESEERVSAAEADFLESQYGIDMAYVRGGTFMMGCTQEQESDCYDYEKQARQVTVSDFYIGKYEVTQAQWKAVMENNPSHFKGDNLPVENISWDDAQEFIKKLNAATGMGYRLPTEAEWEYAARGGGQSRGYKYSGSDDAGEVAWYEGNSENSTHPVGTKKGNELGIHDMSGNVWEWVSDLYENHGGAQQADGEGPFHVIRGGGWGSYARGVRVSNYYNNGAGNRYRILGFRIALNSVVSEQ
ncbi:MAG: formylglycine-generating enzyme family protein [Acidobacteriota bacterium]|jgi:formylglycine-generating enzyme required for sulfatase activity|nr:formylglycine-generating enzyme family protein [Acidobacteriota bacterium]